MEKKLGPTGEFPEGKLNKSDDGEIRLAIGVEGDNVIINFGTPVKWLGLPKAQALEMAKIIKQHAEKLKD